MWDSRDLPPDQRRRLGPGLPGVAWILFIDACKPDASPPKWTLEQLGLRASSASQTVRVQGSEFRCWFVGFWAWGSLGT